LMNWKMHIMPRIRYEIVFFVGLTEEMFIVIMTKAQFIVSF